MSEITAPDDLPPVSAYEDGVTPRHILYKRCLDAELGLVAKALASIADNSDAPVPEPIDVGEGLVEPILARVMTAINEMRRLGQHATVLGVIHHLGENGVDTLGGKATLERLYNMGIWSIGPESAYLAVWRRVRDQLALWDVLKGLEAELSRDDPAAAGEIIDSAAPAFSRIKASASQRPNSLKSLAKRISIRVGTSNSGNTYSSGLPGLDKALGGGFNGGLFYGFQARKKVGKTMWLGTLALNMAQAGVPVTYYCFEMGEERIAERMVAAHYGGVLNSMALIKANGSESLGREVGIYAERYAPDNLLFIDRARPDLKWLEAVAEEQHRARKTRVHVFDYLQLISGTDRRRSRVDQQDEVADWMAEFAKRTSDVVITAAQLNREGETRYGDGLVMAASQVFNIHMREIDLAGFKQREYWLECCDSRYTEGEDAGGKDDWLFYLNKTGPRISQIGHPDVTLIPKGQLGRLG